MEIFLTTVSIVVSISSLCIAITQIVNFFAKPTSILRKKRREDCKEIFEATMEEMMPKYLDEHNKEVAIIFDGYKKELDEIKQLNETQNETIVLLKRNVRDVLRQKIERIYNEYKDTREIPQYEIENLEELFKDYKAAGGNHHIDKLYARMKTWTIIYTPIEYDLE